jgi:hypothetical protein
MRKARLRLIRAPRKIVIGKTIRTGFRRRARKMSGMN